MLHPEKMCKKRDRVHLVLLGECCLSALCADRQHRKAPAPGIDGWHLNKTVKLVLVPFGPRTSNCAKFETLFEMMIFIAKHS
jgi:hypothetical protein